jgi:CheY-like chemotaxis protein
MEVSHFDLEVIMPLITGPPVQTPCNVAPSLTVLIAEDNHEAANSLALILRNAGNSVHVCFDGPSALDAAAHILPEVLVTDIELPGMTGWTLARCVRGALSGRSCLMIAVTGCDQPADRARSYDAGIHLQMGKPIDPAILCRLLAGYRLQSRPEMNSFTSPWRPNAKSNLLRSCQAISPRAPSCNLSS